MFTNSTVFVLGAGASWHYGYSDTRNRRAIFQAQISTAWSLGPPMVRCSAEFVHPSAGFDRRQQVQSGEQAVHALLSTTVSVPHACEIQRVGRPADAFFHGLGHQPP
jgi:hypothetical protein